MKKFIILSYFIISTSLTYSQFISYEYTQILIYSVEINYSYSNGSYQPWSPDLNFYGNALAQMQARYDRNHSILSKEYFKLKDLKLINSTNQSTLNNYRAERLGWIYNAAKSWDLGNETNTATIRNYCCAIYSYSSIKNEITLLQNCQTELNRIKYKDPDNYLYSKRYQSIMKTLDKLKNCSTSEIDEMSWERTELENNTSGNSLSSKSNLNYTYTSNSQKIKIVNISKLSEYTVISLAYDNIQLCSGCWVNYSPNTFLEQNGKKYYLKKAEGIPLSPNKYYFKTSSSLNFDLYFEKSINLNEKFNLIEIQGDANAFNFYNISK